MKNQDWRERFDEEFLTSQLGYLWKDIDGAPKCVWHTTLVKDFITTELQAERERVKKAILDGLPKEKETCGGDSEDDGYCYLCMDHHGYSPVSNNGYNACLSEVKQLVENI